MDLDFLDLPKPVLGRPKIEIEIETLVKLAALHCTQEEAASWLGIGEKTLRRRLKEDKYKEAWELGWSQGLVSLRRTQWKLAQVKPVMAIFLGKQYLGQKDEVHSFLHGELNCTFNLNPGVDESLNKPEEDGGKDQD